MTIKAALSGFWQGLRTPGARVPVVDSMRQSPTERSIPRSWSTAMYPPGRPVGGILAPTNLRGQDAVSEPRAFSYNPGINATMSPRLGYGLMSFSDLRAYAENIPEVAMCIRIITEEIKAFVPRILDDDENEIKDPSLDWIVKKPDRFNPYPVWLSRWLYNVLVYDAGAIETTRGEGGHIISSRIIDGSTMFVLINDLGEQPAPPAPAFQQIINGSPMSMYNTNQIWYRPRHLRADAPYGRSPIEDSLPAVRLLSNLWQYEESWYNEGTTPEQILTAPSGLTADQVLEFEKTFNDRMAGNNAERAGRIRFVPADTQSLSTKDAQFRLEVYQAAANTVRMAYGIPRTEFGESPGTGLGGSGFMEAMQSVFYRMGMAPIKAYVESYFDYVLEQNDRSDLHVELSFPRESLDPQKEEDKATSRFTSGLCTRDEARQKMGMSALGGEIGTFLVDPPGAGQEVPGMGMIPVSRSVPVTRKVPVAGRMVPVGDGAEDEPEEGKIIVKAYGLDASDDELFGMPPSNRLSDMVYGPGDPANEAAYLLDRALAVDDQHYLVPVAYMSDYNEKGENLLVSLPIAGRSAKLTTRLSPDFLEAAAVFDYIAGCSGRATWEAHPENPARPILRDNDCAFKSETRPSSVFIDSFSANISSATANAVMAVSEDDALWGDIEELVGLEARNNAQLRARLLATSAQIPAV